MTTPLAATKATQWPEVDLGTTSIAGQHVRLTYLVSEDEAGIELLHFGATATYAAAVLNAAGDEPELELAPAFDNASWRAHTDAILTAIKHALQQAHIPQRCS